MFPFALQVHADGYLEQHTVVNNLDVAVAPRNFILNSLPAQEFQLLSPLLEWIDMPSGFTLQEADAPIAHMYFIEEGMASLVIPLEDGTLVEVATVGHEGIVSPQAAFSAQPGGTRALGQVAGEAFRVSAAELRETIAFCPVLRHFAFSYLLLMFESSAQSVACVSQHIMHERLARWLLVVRLNTGRNEFGLTQEFIAEMLGVRRPSVTVAALTLQNAGLIQYKRGRHHHRGRSGTHGECLRVLRTAGRCTPEIQGISQRGLARWRLGRPLADRPGVKRLLVPAVQHGASAWPCSW